MIGKLKGIIDDKQEGSVLLDVHGVGYDVFCSNRTLSELPAKGEAAILFIETIVREDFIKLYGFATAVEREWFRLLTTVQGVGAKVALAILSTLNAQELTRAIALQDKTAVARTPGVGPKLAARLVQELKDKSPVDSGSFVVSESYSQQPQNTEMRDAVSALVNLGYSQNQASETVLKLLHANENATAAVLIRGALKELAAR